MNKLKYIPEIDFTHFCRAAANIEDMKSTWEKEKKSKLYLKQKNADKTSEEYFKDASEYMASLSFVQKNTLNLFFHQTSILSEYLMYVTYDHFNLDLISIESFRKFIVKMSETEIEMLPKSFNEVYAIIKDHYDSPNNFEDFSKTTSLIMDIIKDPNILEETFKTAIIEIFNHFVENKVTPRMDEVKTILLRHQKIMDKDPEHFLTNLTKGQLNPNEVNSDMQGILSLYSPFSLYISIGHRIFVYGYNLEEVLVDENETEYYLALLKFLSDPKRYQMIQMLSKKKWYSNELAKKFNITPATMSYHVNKLFGLGLIHFEQGDQNKLYIELDNERLAYLMKKMQDDLLN